METPIVSSSTASDRTTCLAPRLHGPVQKSSQPTVRLSRISSMMHRYHLPSPIAPGPAFVSQARHPCLLLSPKQAFANHAPHAEISPANDRKPPYQSHRPYRSWLHGHAVYCSRGTPTPSGWIRKRRRKLGLHPSRPRLCRDQSRRRHGSVEAVGFCAATFIAWPRHLGCKLAAHATAWRNRFDRKLVRRCDDWTGAALFPGLLMGNERIAFARKTGKG